MDRRIENKEYILCAAIKRIEPKNCMPYHDGTNDICNIEIGFRHHDIFQRFPGEVSKKSDNQGFYTSRGRFVDRHEAMYIAWKAEQVSNDVALRTLLDILRKDLDEGNVLSSDNFKKYFNKLYSEDLY
jgi:hypothetical protein